MEAEAAKLRELTAASDATTTTTHQSSLSSSSTPGATGGDRDGDSFMTDEDRQVDSRSVYVGNVSPGWPD